MSDGRRTLHVRRHPQELAVGGNVTYALLPASESGGWTLLASQSITLELASTTRLFEPFPNPSRDRIVVPFEIATAQPVRIAVYDVTGRVVTELWNGRLPAARGQMVWSGLDSHGRRAAAGVYWVRLTGRSTTATRKVLLVG